MAARNGSSMPLGKTFIVQFGAGILFGFSFAYLILQTNYSGVNLSPSQVFKCLRYSSSLHDNKNQVGFHSYEVRQNTSRTTFPASHVRSTEEDAHGREDAAFQRPAEETVRVLCWVMTSPSHHYTKAIHVNNTWGRRCNKLIFMSSESDEKLGAVGLPNVKEGRDWLWAKTKEAFKYVWKHHRDEADWFMKTDDDTYVIVENLRLMLSHFSPDDPVYFGCHFKLNGHGYMSGGSGYVLSREAVRRFFEQALPDKNKCKESHQGSEDLEIGKCLEAVGVQAGDSRDIFGRYRFLPLEPEKFVVPGNIDPSFWYWHYIYYPQTKGMDCCSEVAISFHYIDPSQMYVMEYLIYHLRLVGRPPYNDSHWRKELTEMAFTNKTATALDAVKVDSEPERENVTLIDKNKSGGNP